jgi:nitroreductase/ketosteroid isomerase-like protein
MFGFQQGRVPPLSGIHDFAFSRRSDFVYSGSKYNQQLTRRRTVKDLLLLFVLCLPSVILCCSATAAENRPGLSLKETFDIYVKSVQNSDLRGFFGTVTGGDGFFFLTADGRMLNRDEYHKFHQDWFKETGWEMPVELLKVQEGKEYGYTNAIFYYRQGMPDGRRYNLDSYFTLIFRKEDGMWKVVADVCTPIARFISEPDSEMKYDMDQEFLFRIMKERRTVRKFKPDRIPNEHIRKILDAARFAPTAGNIQPWKFLVIKDRARLDSLEQILKASWEKRMAAEKHLDDKTRILNIKTGAEAIADIMTAPVYILVFVNPTVYPHYATWDGCLAAENLMLAARALGYGTGFFTSYFPEEMVKSFVKAPDKLRFVCATPIGLPEEWPETPEKKSLDEIVVYESFESK